MIQTVHEGSTSVNRTAVAPPGTFSKWSTGCAGAAQVNTARRAAQFCLSGLTFGLSTQIRHHHLSVFRDLMRYGQKCFKSFFKCDVAQYTPRCPS